VCASDGSSHVEYRGCYFDRPILLADLTGGDMGWTEDREGESFGRRGDAGGKKHRIVRGNIYHDR
jgi:hypothetical protein